MQETSQGTKVLFYILSFLVPLAGIIIGVIYLGKPDEDSKALGKVCLIIALAAIVLSGICYVAGVGAMLGLSKGHMPVPMPRP